eukprot:CAMPEP_0177649036 /NCGR_PEP_ID=MMETSP0447-20121125/11153_1 /TAXON_ID=0 /ORGANISM="Stygamoeba regulata, Strain BSH-02190019" /LENGTH=105 /DNA_ID=CAMNT_0019151729 /DNA_START=144 /DNA_END=461 /DNA_ORIENTATION=-
MVKEVKDIAEFRTIIADAGDKLVMVDFFAVWCGPCKRIAPKIDEFAATYPDVVFIKVDVENVEEAAAEAKVSAMPTFVFYKNGNRIDDLVGADPNKLEDLIKKHK